MDELQESPVVVCAVDSNYTLPLAIMLETLDSRTAAGVGIRVFVLADNVSRMMRARVGKGLSPRIELNWISIEGDKLSALPLSHHITRVAYARILIPDLLPQDVDHVLYLDCDLLLFGDICELWEQYDPRVALQAVPESFPIGDARGVKHEALGIAPAHPYLSDGLMLMNLDKWRAMGAGARIMGYLNDFRDIIQFHDMDGINAILWHDWKAIDKKWYTNVDCAKPSDGADLVKQVEQLNRHGGVMHFGSAVKPWHYGVEHPAVDLYMAYVDRTAWKGWRPRPPWRYVVRRMLLNRHWYGALIRKLPIIGRVWKRV